MKFPHACSFGLGYKLTLVKAGEAFDQERLTAAVMNHVPTVQPLSCAGGEISFRLPREQSANFPELFRELETERTAMGVGGYGVSVTSLEEVFLSLEMEGNSAKRVGDREGSGVGKRSVAFRNDGRGLDEPIGYSTSQHADGVGTEKACHRQDNEGWLPENRLANGYYFNGTAVGYSKDPTNGSTINSSARRSEAMADKLCEIELQSMTAATTVSRRLGSREKPSNGKRHAGGEDERFDTFPPTHAGHKGFMQKVDDDNSLAEDELAMLLAERRKDGHSFAFDGTVRMMGLPLSSHKKSLR